MNEIIIRRECPEDYREVEQMTREAFWDVYEMGANEHYLAHVLRRSPDFIPELDLVAELDGKIVGNIMYTKSFVETKNGKKFDTATFGPLGVLPEYQGRGIGGRLIRESAKLARKMGFPVILIYGDPDYYSRLGFVPAKQLGITNPDGKYPAAHQVLKLDADALAGVSGKAYESESMQTDPKEVEEFEKGFPPKEKKKTESQEKFIRISQTYL